MFLSFIDAGVSWSNGVGTSNTCNCQGLGKKTPSAKLPSRFAALFKNGWFQDFLRNPFHWIILLTFHFFQECFREVVLGVFCRNLLDELLMFWQAGMQWAPHWFHHFALASCWWTLRFRVSSLTEPVWAPSLHTVTASNCWQSDALLNSELSAVNSKRKESSSLNQLNRKFKKWFN